MRILRTKEHRRLLIEWWTIPVIYGAILWVMIAAHGWIVTAIGIAAITTFALLVYFCAIQIPKITRDWINRGE